MLDRKDLTECIHELQSTPGASIRGSAKKYGVSESTIKWRLSKYNSGDSLKRPGKKYFIKKKWKNVAHCIGIYLFHYLIFQNSYEIIVNLF